MVETRAPGNSNPWRTHSPTLIQASPADVNVVLPMVKKYYGFDDIRFRTRAVRNALEILLKDLSLGRVWLIYVGHKAAGYTVVTFGYDLEFGGRQATITELYIRDHYRRLGLGTKILKFVEASCRELGVKALELQVARRNTAAQDFYFKLGYKRHDRIPLSKLIETKRVKPHSHKIVKVSTERPILSWRFRWLHFKRN